MSRARNMVFNVFTTLSLIVLAALPIGYTGTCGVAASYTRSSGRTSSLRALPILSILLERGRLAIWWDQRPPAGSPIAAPPAGLRWQWIRPQWHTPSLSRSLWEFDTHSLPTGPGARLFLFACPIWCVAVPFLVMPSIWWNRRRKRRKEQHIPGFSVVESRSAAKQEAASGPAGLQS